MENEKEKKIESKPKQEFVTFELIQDNLGLKNPVLLKEYLKEIFNCMTNSTHKKGVKYLSKLAFYDYIKLPIFIAEKLFSSLSATSKEGLTEIEFVNGLFRLYMGSFQETSEIIFNLLDFDKDGIINKEDTKIILSYLPLNELNNVNQDNKDKKDFVSKIFNVQIKSLKEIDTIVNETFDKFGNKMNLSQFTKIVRDKNSEIFLQILCFLYDQIPFNSKNIDELKKKFNLLIEDDEFENISKTFRRFKKSNTIKIKPPKYTSLLSPAGSFFRTRKYSLNNNLAITSEINKINNDNDVEGNRNSINSSFTNSPTSSTTNIKTGNIFNFEESNDNKNDPNSSSNIDIVRLENDNILDKNNKINQNENINDLVNRSRKVYVSPTKYLQNKSYIDNQLKTINENEDENEKVEENNNINNIQKENNNVHYENWLFRIINGKKIKYYVVLENKDTFYYKSENKDVFLGMHNLSGCFVKETIEKKLIDGVEYFSFEIFSNNTLKTRKYYSNEEKIVKEFIDNIKKAIGYVKFSDLYEMKEIIGKGKFGVVKLGIHKKTGKKVAIKILKKKNIITAKDKESVRIEIEILKLCHHRNIVRLLDHLENLYYIYIVTEYIEGGTLENYFKKKKFNFSEGQAANIMFQIANGIKYLHQYGIVHRDLKPDNIMITQPNNYGDIKIMDFGLSKIVSPNEKMVEGYGTVLYVAPEVILRTPYNKEVDIWSMGVILFYMLSGQLPFKSTKEKELAKKIVYEEEDYDENIWAKRSQKAVDLISSCLEKKPEDRINIDQFLDHPWFKKYLRYPIK